MIIANIIYTTHTITPHQSIIYTPITNPPTRLFLVFPSNPAPHFPAPAVVLIVPGSSVVQGARVPGLGDLEQTDT